MFFLNILIYSYHIYTVNIVFFRRPCPLYIDFLLVSMKIQVENTSKNYSILFKATLPNSRPDIHKHKISLFQFASYSVDFSFILQYFIKVLKLGD